MLRDLFSLFPAYAGVIPNFSFGTYGSSAFPRIRGGDPNPQRRAERASVLFPAYAGVILKPSEQEDFEYTFPRIRGGDPTKQYDKGGQESFSPHTRG